MPLTSIITVNYNQPQATLEFLESLKNYTELDDVEVILIDNGSKADFELEFRSKYHDIKYYRSNTNLGFAGGNNLGIEFAQGEYLLFLNNDTEISEQFIGKMISEFEVNPEIGMLSPLILYHEEKNRIQYAGYTEMNYFTGRNKALGSHHIDIGQYTETSCETAFIHGAAMMCRRSDLASIGLMEENYFLYYEELDWSERFKRAGKKIWFTGKTHIYHKESISVGKDSSLKTFFMTRNRILFIRKNTDLLTTIAFYVYFLCFACPKSLVAYYLRGRTDLIPWFLKAIIWNFSNSPNSKRLGFQTS